MIVNQLRINKFKYYCVKWYSKW